MFVIEVIPLSRSAPPGSLSYRVKERLPLGSLVEVPLRKQEVLGIIVGIESVQDVRATLRKATYTLRAGNPKLVGKVPKEIMAAASLAAAYHATTLGAVLSALLPEVIPESGFEALTKGEGFEERFLELPESERWEEYAKRARYANAEGKATLVIVPTLIEAERARDYFKATKLEVTLITSALTGKKRALAVNAASESKSLIVATPSFALVPIRHLGSVILERESAGSYALQKRPYLDIRIVARALSHAREVPFTIGDYPLRMETRPKAEAAIKESTLGIISILNVKKKVDEQKTEFLAVPERMREDLRKVVRAGGRSLVIAVRKGYAPAVVCRDCGTLVKDERGRALALIGTASGKPVLRSSDGETFRAAKALCDKCGSWNLLPLGIGVERVVEELRKAVPEAEIIRFDAESVKTPKLARAALAAFAAPGSVLVGTEAALPWLSSSTPLEYAGIASADSLLALPFWRARERLVHLAFSLRSKAKRVVLATRRPEDTAFTTIADPTDAAYFEEESAFRKALKYPPYAELISLAFEGSKERVEETSNNITALTAAHAPFTIAPRPIAKGRYRGTILLKLARGAWPDPALAKTLAELPPSVRILINPESFW